MLLCLGIETSCDETGLALVDEHGIRAQVLSTQIDLHALFGGVVPELASREHAKLIPLLFDELLAKANIEASEIQGIAVANGPGLLGSLLVGVAFAKSLALALDIPIIGVNHLHAHLASVGLSQQNSVQSNLSQALEFPALGLLVSGGHTHLYEIKNFHTFKVLGKTLDDAAGEACDKFAKMLTLPYPGGALLDMLGKQGTVNVKLFPRPYIKNDNLDFSFSGLKTSAQQFLNNNPFAKLPKIENFSENKKILTTEEHKERIKQAPQILSDAAASYLYAIADTLVIKTSRALSFYEKNSKDYPKSIILAGGVAANSFVRAEVAKFAEKNNLNLLQPPLNLCTDNGEMIAFLGRYLLMNGFKSDLSFPAYPRGTKE